MWTMGHFYESGGTLTLHTTQSIQLCFGRSDSFLSMTKNI